MMKAMNKSTEKIKANRPHWKHQGKDGQNYKGNAIISARMDIKTMSVHISRRKESTT